MIILLFKLDDCLDDDLNSKGEIGSPLYLSGSEKVGHEFGYCDLLMGRCLSFDATELSCHNAEYEEYAE